MSGIQSKDSSVPSRPLRILIAEDSRDDLELTIRELEKSDLDVEIDSVSTREAFAEKLRSHMVDMVLSDYRMPGWTGMDAFSEIVKSGQDIPLILVTGTLGDLKAVECIQIGMADYVLKQQLARLPMAILRAQEAKLLRDAEKETAAALRDGGDWPGRNGGGIAFTPAFRKDPASGGARGGVDQAIAGICAAADTGAAQHGYESKRDGDAEPVGESDREQYRD
jgi:CheY-like chemotaxis protein